MAKDVVAVRKKVVVAYRCPERLEHVFKWYGVAAKKTPGRVRLLGRVVEGVK